MRKLKRLFAGAIAAACALMLFACSGSAGSYVENSLGYNFENLSSIGTLYISTFFDVEVNTTEKCTVKYTLELYSPSKKIAEETFETEIDPSNANGKKVRVEQSLWRVEYETSSTYSMYVQIKDVTVTEGKDGEYPTDHKELSIGFGVTGGLVMVAIAALFVVYKKRDPLE